MMARVVPVGLLTSYIRELFDGDALLGDLWVEGEVSESFVSRAGHVYFTLRDVESQLKCALFRAQAIRQERLPRPGDQIAAHGHVSLYERDGSYQLYVDVVQPAGIGFRALQLERLRQQLEAEGLFDPARKRPTPVTPRCIGVVTSADGAVWHDIQTVLRHRFPLVHLLLAAAPVQGERAAAGVVAALEALQDDDRAEVIIIARGGGAVEDLWCFNDERIARAVFACRIPVVSAIGHETDWTLIDDVADLRAATPSAAAELCSPSGDELRSQVRSRWRDTRRHVRQALAIHRAETDRRCSALERSSPGHALTSRRDRLGALSVALNAQSQTHFDVVRSTLDRRRGRAAESVRERVSDSRARVALGAARLDALEPLGVLRRGYAILTTDDGLRPVLSVDDVAPSAPLAARVGDGTIISRVERVAHAGERQGAVSHAVG